MAALTPARDARASGSAILPALVAALTYACLAQGGFHPSQGAILAVVAASIAVLVPEGTLRAAAPGLIAMSVGGVALVVSAWANGWPEQARQPMLTWVIAVAALLAGRAVVKAGESRALMSALAALGAGVALAGMAGLAVHGFPLAMRAQGIWRTSSTLTYANSTGCFLTLTLFACVATLRARPSAVARMGTAVVAAGLATTLSRGGLLGALAGGVVAAAMGGRDVLRRAARPLAGGAVIAAGLIPSIAGAEGRPLPALAGLFAGLFVAAAPVGRKQLAIALAAGAIATVAIGSQHVDTLFEARLSAASEDRLRTWGNVLRASTEDPLLGTGPGTFAMVETEGDTAMLTRYAHNEYLQAFAETGAVGVVSMVVMVALLARWMMRHRPRRGDRAMWALAAGACVAFAVHSGFDFVWRMPLLVATAFVWLAAGTEGEADRHEA